MPGGSAVHSCSAHSSCCLQWFSWFSHSFVTAANRRGWAQPEEQTHHPAGYSISKTTIIYRNRSNSLISCGISFPTFSNLEFALLSVFSPRLSFRQWCLEGRNDSGVCVVLLSSSIKLTELVLLSPTGGG